MKLETLEAIGCGALLIGGAGLAIIGAALVSNLPAVPVATFPAAFTGAHATATGALFVGALAVAFAVIASARPFR